MNTLRLPALFLLILAALAAGCIHSESPPYSQNQEKEGLIVSESGFFVAGVENRLKISIFDDTTVENIISPAIIRNLGHYPEIKYEMSEILIPQGKENPLHMLKDTTETVFILSGFAGVKINGSVFTLSAGDTLFIPKDTFQIIGNCGEDRLSYLSVTYPPYMEENEIFPEGEHSRASGKNMPVLIPADYNSSNQFFEEVRVSKILDQEILREKGDNSSFGIGMARVVIPEGAMTTPHILEGTTEVMHFLSGEGILHVNRNTMQVRGGDTAYIPPGGYQSLVNSGEEELVYLTITDPAYRETVDSSVSG